MAPLNDMQTTEVAAARHQRRAPRDLTAAQRVALVESLYRLPVRPTD